MDSGLAEEALTNDLVHSEKLGAVCSPRICALTVREWKPCPEVRESSESRHAEKTGGRSHKLRQEVCLGRGGQ